MPEAAQRAHEDRLVLAEKRRQERREQIAEETRKRAVRRESRRRHRSPITPEQVTAKDEWMRVPFLAQCEACGVNPAEERHHALREQDLRKHSRSHGYDFELVRWDRRLRVLLCSSCHASHTDRSKRLPFSILRQETIDFAVELGLLWLLEQEYAA